jgi:aldehyde dehydrogenase (NAD+)
MDFLENLGIEVKNAGSSTGATWDCSTAADPIEVTSPVDGRPVAGVYEASVQDCERVIRKAEEAFPVWREMPAPQRGEIIRQIGNRTREHKKTLGALISHEMGKPLQEALGEVQEMIDICDFSVGQSRMLYGSTIHSERVHHRMYDQYHPLGLVGIVTAFNFPVAVWAWNAMVAAVCGDVTLWKPSCSAPLTAIAVQKIVGEVVKENGLPEGVFSLLIGRGSTIGEQILQDGRVALVSFTGSIATGRHVAETVSKRLGKTLLELGGNNAIIMTEHANLKLAIPAVVFGAVGTAGQRCTTTRRLIIHESIYDKVKRTLMNGYDSLHIGNPLDEKNHMGPLVNQLAVANFGEALLDVQSQGGSLLWGGETLSGEGYESGCYVRPAIVEAENHYPIVQEETFAPILYLIRYGGGVANAIAIQNGVRQGLSSSIFTDHVRQAEAFLSAWGSDCGIANVNIGTSGAEIGGAFGGEKESGGGRESGSDAWKAYMRRQTVTINFSNELPLAQGIRFDI